MYSASFNDDFGSLKNFVALSRFEFTLIRSVERGHSQKYSTILSVEQISRRTVYLTMRSRIYFR